MTQDEQDDLEERRCIRRAQKMLDDTFVDGENFAIVMTTMTYAVAGILELMEVDPAMFFERVKLTMQRQTTEPRAEGLPS